MQVERVTPRLWTRAVNRLDRPAWAAAWQAFWTSRLAVFCAGVLAVLGLGEAPGYSGYDPARLTAPFHYLGNLLVAPFARWDSVWYLQIAQSGYDHQAARTAFFPLYPLLMRGLGVVIGSDLVAGICISLAAFLVALVLLYRLVALELDAELARITVLLIAFCPMAYFFSAVYSESLFLALSVGCIWLARTGRWGWAGLLGGLAAAERASGITLVVPFVLLYLYGPRVERAPALPLAGRPWLRRIQPRYRPGWALLWVLLIPAGLGAYALALALLTGNGLAPFSATSTTWFRHFAPFGGVWDGAVAAWDGLRQLVHGPAPPIYFKDYAGNPLWGAGANVMLFGFLVLGAVALVGTFRRLPVAYGAWCLAAVALPLSYPVIPQPLQSLPRYEMVLFPLFMWGAWWLRRRQLVTPAIATLAVLLGLFTAEFATWRFVA
jgi:Mannosyltransferase (PIG-V)